MIIATNGPLPIGSRIVGNTLIGGLPFLVLREATFEEFLVSANDENIKYPPSRQSREADIEEVKSKLHFFYEISVD